MCCAVLPAETELHAVALLLFLTLEAGGPFTGGMYGSRS